MAWTGAVRASVRRRLTFLKPNELIVLVLVSKNERILANWPEPYRRIPVKGSSIWSRVVASRCLPSRWRLPVLLRFRSSVVPHEKLSVFSLMPLKMALQIVARSAPFRQKFKNLISCHLPFTLKHILQRLRCKRNGPLHHTQACDPYHQAEFVSPVKASYDCSEAYEETLAEVP